MKDCLVFLVRGVVFVEGQGALVDPGYAYAVRDEELLRLGGNAIALIMGEGQMKGICAQKTGEFQQKYRAEKEAEERRQRQPWNRAVAMFRRRNRGAQNEQCATQ